MKRLGSVALVVLACVVMVALGVLPARPSPAEATGSFAMFGNGSDGAITFSSNTTFNPPVDAVVDSASSGGTTLTLSSVSGVFQAGQKILIHQTRGTGAGAWELNTVQSYALGNKVTVTPLAHTYTTSGANAAQVLVVPQYTNVTVNTGVTVSAKAWGGNVGGILAFLANGNVTVSGTITAQGKGYRFGPGLSGSCGHQGEGTPGIGGSCESANGNGGGGGGDYQNSSAGGGGNGTTGSDGTASAGHQGIGGSTSGTVDLTVMVFGGGGGGVGAGGGQTGNDGGSGGGIVALFARNIAATGSTIAAGNNGTINNRPGDAGGGAGAGGSILIKTESATFGSSVISATGGAGGVGGTQTGGGGGLGRIRVEYCTSISGGTANPPASIAQISCGPKTPVPTPVPVGGIAALPDVDAAPLESARSSRDAGIVAGIVAGVVGFATALTAAAWYRRRR